MTTTEDNVVLQKTRDLCQAILEHPEFQMLRRNIDSFMSNEAARTDYESLLEKGDVLHQKQHQGVKLDQSEIAEYEKHRDRVVNNPIASGFLKAQEEMHKVQETVTKMLAKSFELGRVPDEEELSGGSCGTGCGCH